MARYYDKCGNEIPTPQPQGKLEHVCEIGGEFDRCYVSLSFFSKQMKKDKVTRLLGKSPTKAWNPGERHPIGNGKSGITKIDDWGKWILDTELDETSPEDKIRKVFSLCTDDLSKWEEVGTDFEGTLAIVVYADNWNRDLLLSSDILRMISDRRLSLWVDASFEENNTVEQGGGEERR